MNKSERLLSAFAETYFYKELIFDNLCFSPETSTEHELADLIINLGDVMIAIQLKSRNVGDQTNDPHVENKWVEKKCREAKKQAKETLREIASGILPSFKNKREQRIRLKPNAKVIPLIVFDNRVIFI